MAKKKKSTKELSAELTEEQKKENLQTAGEMLGNVPPQAIEIEQAVLGALMLERSAVTEVQEILRPEAFYKETHRIIYEAIQELSIASEPVDIYTVANKLLQNNRLKEVGGNSYLTELCQKVGSAANLEYHAKIVLDKFIQRELIAGATDIQKKAFSEQFTAQELLTNAESIVFNISQGNLRNEVQSGKDVVCEALKVIEENRNKPDGMNGVPSHYSEIDRVTLGWQPSDLIIIAARPAMGKTAFVLTMARNITVEYNKPVAVFSLEMSSVQLMTRLLVGESELDSKKLKSGKLTPDEWSHLENAAKRLQNAPLWIDETPGLSIFEFRSKARKLRYQHKVELIIVDYLQLMTTGISDGRGNREQEVALISRSLKAIAKELKIPIIALAQLNRAAEMQGGNKRPQMSNLRESGSIEQDADIVAFIHRPEYYGLDMEDGSSSKGVAEFIFAKNRNGELATPKLRFIGSRVKFTDWDDTSALEDSNYQFVDSQAFQSPELGIQSSSALGSYSDSPDDIF